MEILIFLLIVTAISYFSWWYFGEGINK